MKRSGGEIKCRAANGVKLLQRITARSCSKPFDDANFTISTIPESR